MACLSGIPWIRAAHQQVSPLGIPRDCPRSRTLPWRKWSCGPWIMATDLFTFELLSNLIALCSYFVFLFTVYNLVLIDK